MRPRARVRSAMGQLRSPSLQCLLRGPWPPTLMPLTLMPLTLIPLTLMPLRTPMLMPLRSAMSPPARSVAASRISARMGLPQCPAAMKRYPLRIPSRPNCKKKKKKKIVRTENSHSLAATPD